MSIKVIWSADGIPKNQLIKILSADQFPREKVAVKLDRAFCEHYGLLSIGEIQRNCEVKVFDDAKIIEIPSKVMQIVERHLGQQPWMLNVMAGACSNMQFLTPGSDQKEEDCDLLYRFAITCKQANTKSCAVTVLTSKTAATIRYEYRCTPKQAVANYATLMTECGFTDIVCSPNEAETLIDHDYRLDINTHGVRLSDSNKDDQARVQTPHEAIHSGVKRIVCGRDIYDAKRDDDNYHVVYRNIQRIFDNIEGRN